MRSFLRLTVLVLLLGTLTGVALFGSPGSGGAELPVVAQVAADDAEAAGPVVVVVVGGVRYVVTRVGPWAYRVCARRCHWVPKAFNVYDAIGKARYAWCVLVQRRPDCQL